MFTRALPRTPTTFSQLAAKVTASATASLPASPSGTNAPSASPSPAASVATVPVKIAKNDTQPVAKPANGENASRRYT